MHLTAAQFATLKAFVFASTDPAIIAARNQGNTYDLSILLSAPASPVVKAWRTEVPARDLDQGADYAAFDTLAAGKRDAWSLFLQYAPRDMSKNRNRKVVTDVWGNATANSTSEAVLQASTENANVAEVAIGGSTTSTGTVSALNRAATGPVTQEDAQRILAA